MDASWEAWHALGLQANGGSRVLFKLHVLTNLISAGKTGRQKKTPILKKNLITSYLKYIQQHPHPLPLSSAYLRSCMTCTTYYRATLQCVLAFTLKVYASCLRESIIFKYPICLKSKLPRRHRHLWGWRNQSNFARVALLHHATRAIPSIVVPTLPSAAAPLCCCECSSSSSRAGGGGYRGCSRGCSGCSGMGRVDRRATIPAVAAAIVDRIAKGNHVRPSHGSVGKT